ncbi:MAG: molybdopterin-synthase adenylyltransferase MoeB [Planctomycetota bacterium]
MTTPAIDILGSRVDEVSLSPNDIKRYSRHLIMPEVGMEGQKRLKAARVLCVGTGGLGSPLAFYLAAAGIGTIGLVDFDTVDESNLQRQILHSTKDIGRPKVLSASEKLVALNPDLNVVQITERITSENALQLFADYDVIVDGTDNFATRYLVNDACVLLNKPNVYGSIFRFDGQATVFFPPYGPCYRCLYPEPPPAELVPNCAEGGVLGILPGVIGVIQATETVKIILGRGRTLQGRLMLYDALDMSFREMKVRKNPKCPICGPNKTITALIDYEAFCSGGNLTGSHSTSTEEPQAVREMESKTLQARVAKGDNLVILDVRNPEEIDICRIQGSVVIPLPELPKRLGELSAGDEIVVHCKSGMRSQKAIKILQSAGFKNLHNLTGGILAWIQDVDKNLPTY